MRTSRKYYRVDRREIGYLRFIFEAYDGIAVISTLDDKKGIVLFHIPPGCEKDVEEVLKDLKKTILIETIRENELMNFGLSDG